MSEFTGPTGLRGGATAVVHESYSFACMSCGLGWEQAYEIEHHKDADGQEFVRYVADGRVVPSPLQRPRCQNCDSHVIRIMRPGSVASIRGVSHDQHRVPPAGPLEVPQVPQTPRRPQASASAAPVVSAERRHWHLSDLLHALHLHRKDG
ncbi:MULTISPECIES: hypothetical protein [unclassified Streptomyces]|uniref:hypothetical protein n=1 Tax=unclassified Streptomyces TaxID=2593676 RepID=UPI0036FC337B